MDAGETQGQQWYAGLPVVETRPLTENELVELRDCRLEARVAVRKLLVYPLVLAGLSIVAWAADLWLIRIIIAAQVLRWIWRGVPGGIIRTYRLSRDLMRDADRGVVQVCAGLSGDLAARHPALYEGSGIVGTPRDQAVEIQVLPESKLLWRRNGRYPGMFCLIPPSLTAFAPEHAQMAANFVKPLDDEGRVFCHERPLSEAELAELAKYTPRFEVAEMTLLVMLFATALAGVWLAVSAHPLNLGWTIAAAAGIAWRGRTVLRFLRRRFLITRDIHDGRVMIVRFRRGDDVDEQSLSPAYEVLPNSRLEWSEAGMPSRWRKILGSGRALHFRLGRS